MDSTSAHTFLTDILHAMAQALLNPVILLLLIFAGYALFCIGSILMEFFTERRNFKVSMPKFLAELMAAEEKDIPQVIARSGLLNRQKEALVTVYEYRSLPGDALLALIRRLVNDEETRYNRISGRNNTAAKISPMLGLMGTLIPLGPGVEALGRNDTSTLSSSLLVAFDTTVAGLIVAAVCLAVGKIRSNWYNDYLSALDSAMATMLQKIEDLRAAGKIEELTPDNYSFMFEKNPREARNAAGQQADETPSASLASGPTSNPASSPASSSASSLASNPAQRPTSSTAKAPLATPSEQTTAGQTTAAQPARPVTVPGQTAPEQTTRPATAPAQQQTKPQDRPQEGEQHV